MSLSYTTTCENCGAEIECMLYEGDDGQPDPNQPCCCPPEDSYWEPGECPECGHAILIEDCDELLSDRRIAAQEFRDECRMEDRMEGRGG